MGRVKELFLVYEFIKNYINVSLILFINKFNLSKIVYIMI